MSVISLFFVGNVQCADKVPEKTLNLDLVDLLFIGDHTIIYYPESNLYNWVHETDPNSHPMSFFRCSDVQELFKGGIAY